MDIFLYDKPRSYRYTDSRLAEHGAVKSTALLCYHML